MLRFFRRWDNLLAWQQRQSSLNQRFNTFAVNGADRENLVETKLREFRDIRFSLVRVDLVDGNQHRLTALAQTRGGFPVERYHAFLDVNDKDDDIGGLDRDLHLFERGTHDHILRFLTPQ